MRSLAHSRVSAAVLKGTLVRQPCEICGKTEIKPGVPINAHHDDYTKPLEVRWLCDKHHGEVHSKTKPEGKPGNLNIRKIPDDLHLQFKIHAAEQGKTMQDLIFELIEAELKEKGLF